MKLFVTGATGFLGRAVCRLALRRGHEVLALCRDGGASLPAGAIPAHGSLGSIPWTEVEEFEPDAVLHLAWVATPGVYLTSPENDVLLEQSTGFFEKLAAMGVRHVAGVGTCIEYAPSTSPLAEWTSSLGPTFPYSVAKVEASRRLQDIAARCGTAWSWLRVFYPYGEGEAAGRLPSILMRAALAGQKLELRTPDSVKDYIHVEDAASAMLSVLEHGLSGPVNIGTGEGLRILDLAGHILRSLGADPALAVAAAVPAHDPFPITVADTTRLRSTGWMPEVSLHEGLARLGAALSAA